MTFAGEDLYADVAAKAAALIRALALNHFFMAGNTRVGIAAAELFLEFDQYTLDATDDELEAITLSAAQGKLAAEVLAIWIRQRLREPSSA